MSFTYIAQLKMVPLTRELCDNTTIDKHVDALREHADGGVSALAVRMVETCAVQLAREPHKSAAPKPPPKPAESASGRTAALRASIAQLNSWT